MVYNRETLQQDTTNYLPGTLCTAPEGETSEAYECQVFIVMMRRKGILVQELRLHYLVITKN